MIFRTSAKLNARIKGPKLAPLPMSDGFRTDWSMHLFVIGRFQYVLFCNTRTLYSVVTVAKGINSVDQLVDRAFTAVPAHLRAAGFAAAADVFTDGARAEVRQASALNRSITGSINDMVNMAWYHLDTPDGTIGASETINSTPFSALGVDAGQTYDNPRRVIDVLLNRRAGK